MYMHACTQLYIHCFLIGDNATYTSDEKIPITNCAAYTITNSGFEEPLVSKETTTETDYENPDAVSLVVVISMFIPYFNVSDQSDRSIRGFIKHL